MLWEFFDFEEERRRTLTLGDKKYLLLKARGKCEYCGCSITEAGIREEIHHIKPFAEGGSDSFSNLIVLCPNCHSRTDSIPPEEFKKKIAYRLPKAKVKTKASPKSKPKTKALPKVKAKTKAPTKAKATTKASPKAKVKTQKTKRKAARPARR